MALTDAAALDFNRDGHRQILRVATTNTLIILQGNGDGSVEREPYHTGFLSMGDGR